MFAVKVENISKKFRVLHEKPAFVKDVLPKIFGKARFEEFWALRDISFQLEKGKSLGIVGSNGAGKSTLLNVLSGVTYPTQGKINMNGKLSTILSLGAGFHPELSGIDNIYLNASILGMKMQEIKQKLSSIVKFSELDGFIDAPIQTYSTGMLMRLGFSTAIHVDFDILLLDEILSVGDIHFQQKCIDKLREFRKQQKTLVIASQSLSQLEELCDEIIFLDKARIEARGMPKEIIKHYVEHRHQEDDFRQKELRLWAAIDTFGKKMGNKYAEIKKVNIQNGRGCEKDVFRSGEALIVKVNYQINRSIRDAHFGVAIFRKDGVYCYGPNTKFDGIDLGELKEGESNFSIKFKNLYLGGGEYLISAAIWDKEEKNPYSHHVGCYSFKIEPDDDSGLIAVPHKWKGFSLFRVDNRIFNDELAVDILNNEGKRSQHVGVKDVMLLSEGKISNSFITNQAMEQRIFLDGHFDYKGSLYLYSAIYREDGVFCQGATRKIKGNSVVLIYPKLPLLSGDYKLCIGITDGQAIMANKTHPFKVNSDKQDHGTIYLEHLWKIH